VRTTTPVPTVEVAALAPPALVLKLSRELAPAEVSAPSVKVSLAASRIWLPAPEELAVVVRPFTFWLPVPLSASVPPPMVSEEALGRMFVETVPKLSASVPPLTVVAPV
jgi:hypothetical protein